MKSTGTANCLTHESLVASPCSNPELGLEEALSFYSELGYRKFELFSSWAKSHVKPGTDPRLYLDLASRSGMQFTSMHLEPVKDDLDSTVKRAVDGARLARELGVGVVIYKADSRDNYIKGAGQFLDAIDGFGVTPVLQNHVGSPITTLEDYREVINGIGDPRMKTLLEVGQFHSIGVSWQQGYELLGDSIALVHIKDQIGDAKVPFGEGEVDLGGLFAHLEKAGYNGNIVVEMEVCRDDTEQTLKLLGQAREYCAALLERNSR